MNKDLIAWLNDAYAMEKDSERVLEHRLTDVENQPEMKSRIEEHLNETRSQAERLKSRIEALGGSVSTLKSGLYNVIGTVKAWGTGMFKDENVKNGIADYTTENMEIASYQALKAGAEELGDQETMKLAEEILQEEMSMAEWIKTKMPTIVKQYLNQQGSGA